MLATKNEQSILECGQVYWKYCSKYASLLDILLVLAVFLVNLHTLSSISIEVNESKSKFPKSVKNMAEI